MNVRWLRLSRPPKLIWFSIYQNRERTYQPRCIFIWLRQLTITRKNIAEKYIDWDDRSKRNYASPPKYFPKKNERKKNNKRNCKCIEYLVHSCPPSCDNYTYKTNRINLEYIIVRIILNMVADYFLMAFLSVNGSEMNQNALNERGRQLSNSIRNKMEQNEMCRPTSNGCWLHLTTV